jgi:hypothetical protein
VNRDWSVSAERQPPFTDHHSLLPAPLPRLAVCAEMRDDSPLSTVTEIKEAIARLSPQEYCELMAELFPHADDEWDKQMKADFASGKMGWLTKETDAAIREEKTIPLERILAQEE